MITLRDTLKRWWQLMSAPWKREQQTLDSSVKAMDTVAVSLTTATPAVEQPAPKAPAKKTAKKRKSK